MRIGLISDTHGLLRPEALAFLQGSDHILHAGDICDASVLDALARIAPVTAVRGNNDHGAWAERLQTIALLEMGQVGIGIVHDLAELDAGFAAAHRLHVVVSGHSHQPHIEQRDGVLYVNPGSAGPRRFRLPVSAGELWLEGGGVRAGTTELLG